MRVQLITVIFFSIYFIGYGQEKKSDINKYNLKGNVESVFSTKYSASKDSSDNIKKGKFCPIPLENVYELNLTSSGSYFTIDNTLILFGKDGFVKTILYFNKRPYQLLYTEVRTAVTENNQNETIYGNGVIYDIQVNIDKGVPVKKRLITERNDTIIANYKYNEINNISDELYMNSKLVSIVRNIFNNKKQIADVYCIITPYQDTVQSMRYSYNNNGDVENETESIRDFIKHRRYEYQYDTNKNWIVRYEFEEEKLVYITEREIKYY